jgi:hypothetical protein
MVIIDIPDNILVIGIGNGVSIPSWNINTILDWWDKAYFLAKLMLDHNGCIVFMQSKDHLHTKFLKRFASGCGWLLSNAWQGMNKLPLMS